MLRKKINVINPDKCILEDLEILSFENEQELNFYTVWHDALVENRKLGIHSKLGIDSAKSSLDNELRGIESKLCVDNNKLNVDSKTTTAAAIDSRKLTNTDSSGPKSQQPARPANEPSSLNATRLLVPPPLPNGYKIFDSTVPCGMLKYKLNKIYRKYRGQQKRRMFVLDKQKKAQIDKEVSKSYLNTWLSYTALQALRLPDPSNIITIDGIFLPNQIITYSNKINPQQVAKYRKNSHKLPASATSKKSSAASYDVFEIMDVLANSTSTNVTITRNATRYGQKAAIGQGQTANNNDDLPPQSVYGRSINAGTKGIVSTQLHLQARSYVEALSQLYELERHRLIEEMELDSKAPTEDELIGKYLYI